MNVSQPVAKETATDIVEPADLKAAYDRLLERQTRIMELIGAKDANHLVHDIRNILNERELLRALVDIEEE